MKTSFPVVALLLAWFSVWSDAPAATNAVILPALRAYATEVVSELDQIPAGRRVILDAVAADIQAQLARGNSASLTFICTHNSRRSHMSQIWANTAAGYFGLENVRAYSGGTEVTACNCRTITAMRSAGFEIEDATTGDNPIYLVRFATNRPVLKIYSKLYNADSNPDRDFIALMTCSSADKSCPVVKGATARHAIHYTDPRLCDDTPLETAAYKERCREIAREMFYIMAQVRQQTQEAVPASGP